MSIEEIQHKLLDLRLENPINSQMASNSTQTISVEAFLEMQKQLKDVLAKQARQKPETKVSIEKDPPPANGTNLKPTKLPLYYGDRENYPAWRTAVLDIFRMDWILFGYDNSRAFLMIFGALKGAALKKAGPFYEAGGVHGTRDPEDFIEFLDRLNLDSTRVSRANDELHAMRMKENQRWPEFFASWSNKLTEARGDFWPDENKISMLRSSLSRKLSRTLAGNHLLPDDDFSEWVHIVNKVAQQIEMTETRFNTSQLHEKYDDNQKLEKGHPSLNLNDHKFSKENESKQAIYRPGEIDDSGDTVMGGINTAGVVKGERRRALWKNKAQIDKLRAEKKCFRCERRGCASGKCPLLPAIKPKNKKIDANSVILADIDPALYTLDKEYSTEEMEAEN